MLTSIGLVVWNRLNLLKQMMPSFLDKTKSDFELVVVDQNSQEDNVNYLYETLGNAIHTNKYLKNFKIIKNTENKGIAIGRNLCLEAADPYAQYLATIDPDVLFINGWLEDSINILNIVPDLGAIGINYEKTSYPLITRKGLKLQWKAEGNLGTACSLFSRSIFKLIGYFNMEFNTLYACEDADYFFRIRCLGYKLGYLQENGIHLGGNEDPNNEYRKFKTSEHNKAAPQFHKNCYLYVNKKKSLYIPFKK